MNKTFLKISIFSGSIFLPTFAFAACEADIGTLQNIICQATDLTAAYIIPTLTTSAFVFFLWRVLKFIKESAVSTTRDENRESLMWSVVALAVMVTIWGIVAVLGNTLGIDSSSIPQVKPPLTKSGWKGYTGGGTNIINNGGSNLGGNGSGMPTGQNGSGIPTGQNGSGIPTGQNGSGIPTGQNGNVQ
ncbi:MAG: hypothetical protein ACR2IQ_01285 [Minisyncoccia bacterium]